ncbi:MAG: Folylpolyglutamate synthase [Candidatus Anoxychlamydiales bacterium]|nr:Folylpolyglutamate synthase [Candidatus Anoxychlamydiales bacterium]
MSEYQKLKNKLFSLFSNKIECRLENISLASMHLNYPDKDFKSIHIAGTNGKGSVATKIAKALSLSGYKVALYTSPHISSYRERISVNGRLISKKDVLFFLDQIFKLQKKINKYLSFFEITTLLAFLYFSKKKVDFAVIETGLGGRLDATNIITPILSIITSIGLDHTDILGDSLDKIATEKSFIIKPNIPVVVGPKANLKPIIQRAKKCTSQLFIAKKKSSFYDFQNAEIAKKAIDILSEKYQIKEAILKKALNLRPRARFEIKKNLGPRVVIFDVAHNSDGFKELKKAIKLFFPKDSIRVILGFSKQKDSSSSIKILKTFVSFIHVVEANYFKALSKFEIETDLKFLKVSNYQIEDSIKKGVDSAKKLAVNNNEILLVTGSFYILDEIQKHLKILKKN